MKQEVQVYSLFTEFDISLFKAGKHYRLYERFGAHVLEVDKCEGVYFSVWAPSATSVSVIGDFNYWNAGDHPLNVRWDDSGIWEGFIPGVKKGDRYKFRILTDKQEILEKADPYALRCEHPPNTASIVWDLNYSWQDHNFMSSREEINALNKPYAVYEVHLGSWRKNTLENRSLSYPEMARELVSYVKEMEFTHVEFMPIMEFPYDPSWGYQITGYFAPTSRFGDPQEFMQLLDAFHQAGIGVILDWVPSHFPEDAHGLGKFDGSHLYEHPDPRKGFHQDWKSLIFNYGRNEVRSFLISNAVFWLDKYHVDGLRVDAVASMLYLDYSREAGAWEPNVEGGRENLDAISFFKDLNTEVYHSFRGVQTIAEESTSFPRVTSPVDQGGLGFGMKWMMGWMHDTLNYFKKNPIHRSHHQDDITFSLTYSFTENFVLPLSHDEVVHGKGSLLGRMPGDDWQKFANLRLMYGYMYTHPGAKLLFMGAELGQYTEWNYNTSLDWHLLEHDLHKGIKRAIMDLNILYKNQPALYSKQFEEDSFEWIAYDDHKNAVISYIRKGASTKDLLVVVCNFTPTVHKEYAIGLPVKGNLEELYNSDALEYGGSGVVNDSIITQEEAFHARKYSAKITVPPLALVVFKLASL